MAKAEFSFVGATAGICGMVCSGGDPSAPWFVEDGRCGPHPAPGVLANLSASGCSLRRPSGANRARTDILGTSAPPSRTRGVQQNRGGKRECGLFDETSYSLGAAAKVSFAAASWRRDSRSAVSDAPDHFQSSCKRGGQPSGHGAIRSEALGRGHRSQPKVKNASRGVETKTLEGSEINETSREGQRTN